MENKLVSVVISTRVVDEKFMGHVRKMFSHPKNEYLVYENNGEYSLSEIYNRGLKESVNDIVVFMHDDIIIETNNLSSKINKIFRENNEYGIIGVAGTDKLTSGMWWENRDNMYGTVGHIHNNKRHVNIYNKKKIGDRVKEVIVIDGLFMMIHKGRIKHNFNEDFNGFHFYDLPICVENHISGVKIGVTNRIRLTHKSIGKTDKKWEKNKLLFMALYEKKLPLEI